MKTFEKYIVKQLGRLSYTQPARARQDVLTTLRLYRCLAPTAETYVLQTGEELELLNLAGTLPILYQEQTYNIPIKVWLLPDYPDSAPLCYVIPGRQMELAVSPYLDHAGLVELPCLQEWDHSSTDLSTLLQIARVTFSETPPVFSRPRKPASTSAESVWEEHFPDQDEKLLRTFFLKSASETCRAKLGEEFSRTKAEVDSLHSVNKELIDRQEEIQTRLQRCRATKEDIEDSIESLQKASETLNLIKSKTFDEEARREDRIEDFINVHAGHTHVLEAIATDEALDDCIYALGLALDSDKLSIEVYLKKVREMSRKQFHCRQTENSLLLKQGKLE